MRRSLIGAVVVLVAVLFNASSARAQLPIGVWRINGNGWEGELVIAGIDGFGNVSGTIYGDRITGVYDAKTQCLSFLRTTKTTSQAWKGYVFDAVGTHYTIAGTFQSFTFGRDVKRVDAGWFGMKPALNR